jgi:signal transduction histidine kinase
MQVRQRLRLNVALSIAALAALVLVLAFAVYRVSRAVAATDMTGAIITDAFERLTLRNDYVQSGTERARVQWFSKHERIGRQLAAAAEIFRHPADQQIIGDMMADQESIGRIFSAIVNNRAKANDPARMSQLLHENEERLITQLNTTIYKVVSQARQLHESSREDLLSALRLTAGGIAFVLILVMAAAIITSWTMGRSITEGIQRLRNGAAIIGGGDLDHRIVVKGEDELAELSRAFNAMALRLRGSYHDLENEIGERKKIEEAIRELNYDLTAKNIQLETANREMESFIYSVSHDLRQPLRAIASFSQMVQKRLQGGLGEKDKHHLARVIDNAARMNNLIDDMLKLSRVSRQEIKPKQVDMTSIAETVVSAIRETPPARCADITIGAGLIAVADQGLMTAVLENLIGNAWKFTAKTEKACIAFGAVKRDKQTVFFVKDNGVGFDPEHAKDMFRPFHRLHSESEFDGTGIGLSIVERIIARHGGEVWAEGCIGKGATVFFTLPPPPC